MGGGEVRTLLEGRKNKEEKRKSNHIFSLWHSHDSDQLVVTWFLSVTTRSWSQRFLCVITKFMVTGTSVCHTSVHHHKDL